MITPTPKRCVWFLIVIHVLWLFGLAHQAYGQWLPRKDGIVLPQEPTIYIVHASWCAPCQRLKRDWANVPGFEQAVDDAYNIVDLDWNIPAKQRIARALGVTSLPTMVVVRNGMVMTAYQGYDGNVQKLMEGILLEWPVVKEPLIPAPRAPPVQAPSPVKPDPRIDQLMQRIEDLASRMSTPPPAVVTPPKPDPPAAKPPVVFPPDSPPLANTDKSDILPPETSRGVGDKWLGVLTTIGKVGLVALAPEVALPASAGLTAVGYVLSQLHKQRSKKQNNKAVTNHHTIVERPVVVETESPPQPGRVEQTNHYVHIENDSHKEAWNWASAQWVKKWPGSEGQIQALNHLINQYIEKKAT